MASGRDCRNVLYLAGSAVKYTEHDMSQNQSLNLRLLLQYIKLQYSEI